MVRLMSESDAPLRWISEYDYPRRRVTLISTEAWRHGAVHRGESLSDPGGDFDVFVTRLAESDEPEIVKIVIRLNEEGDLRTPHPDFRPGAIGSLTIWPYKGVGDRVGLAHWVMQVYEPAFVDDLPPRPWLEAVRKPERPKLEPEPPTRAARRVARRG